MNQNKNQNINVTQRRRNRNRIGLNRHATTNRMTTKIVWFHSYLILIVYDWVSSQPNHHNRAHASTECSKTNFFSSCTPIIRTIRTVRVRAACQRCILNLKSMKKWTLLEPTECVPLFITVIEIDLDFYSFLYTPISSAPSRSNFIIGLWMAAVKKVHCKSFFEWISEVIKSCGQLFNAPEGILAMKYYEFTNMIRGFPLFFQCEHYKMCIKWNLNNPNNWCIFASVLGLALVPNDGNSSDDVTHKRQLNNWHVICTVNTPLFKTVITQWTPIRNGYKTRFVRALQRLLVLFQKDAGLSIHFMYKSIFRI